MTEVQILDQVVIRFSGDSGDGMQLTGDRFTSDSATVGNDFSTLPNFPSEIRAPAGTIGGVSSFQLHFASRDIKTPGDRLDVLVAMNPAALRANLADLRPGGTILADAADFNKRNLTKVGFADNPLTDGSLDDYDLYAIDLTGLAVAAVSEYGLSRKDAARTKNMFALGLLTWLYSRPTEGTLDYLKTKFASNPNLRDANIAAFKAGNAYGETTEGFSHRYEVGKAQLPVGTYRQISGNRALAYGLMAGAVKSGLPLYMGAYPITPASDVLHELSRFPDHGVITFQAEDEIAAAGAALGASWAGHLGVTVTSGPGMSLKSETISLAVMLELPLVVCDVQRAGPSTGMPTKTEQADLSQAMFGRHGEAPLPVLAAQSPGDCFDAAFEACQVAIENRTPVIVLTDGYLANGAEPWLVPNVGELPAIDPNFATEPNQPDGAFWPYLRDENLARALAIPGTPGLEHRIGGLEKMDGTGSVCHEPNNHHKMVQIRQDKVDRLRVPDIEIDDPNSDADMLVLGWGSSWGPIAAAVRRVRAKGYRIAHTHLRWINPFPANLGEELRKYKRIVVPEMNRGQLAMLLRAKYLVDIESYSRVRGLPISPTELETDLIAMLSEEDR